MAAADRPGEDPSQQVQLGSMGFAIHRSRKMCVGPAIVVALVLGSCAGEAPSAGRSSPADSASDPTATAAPTVTSSPAPTTGELASGSKKVSFRSSDGILLGGRLFGSGPTAVVLAHMGREGDSQTDWFPVAARLASEGFSVLTFNRRGVCPGGLAGCSRGDDVLFESWRDILGAIAFVRERGARSILVGGASIGSMASLYALERASPDVAGFMWVSGVDFGSGYDFRRGDVARVGGPKLFISGVDDVDAAASARRLYRYASGPKVLRLLPTGEHGTDMLSSAPSDVQRALIGSIVRFVHRYS
jgi:pimeloyl-ACP methyl ester carboxylesterase